jgi:hypothetical protein
VFGDLSVSAVVVLGALVIVRWVVLLVAAALLVRPATSCPGCFRSTLAIRRPFLSAVMRFAEWRWCPACGWQGLSRLREPDHPWTRRSSRSRI